MTSMLSEKLKNIFELDLQNFIQKHAVLLTVKEGTCILDIGQNITVMPLVLEGTIKISRIEEDGRELLLYYINPNESCAMTFTCCMQEQPSEIRAVAEEDATILALPIALMDEMMANYSTWKSFVMGTIRNRFGELLKTIDSIAFHRLDERLVHYLLDKATVTDSTLLHISHEQIANELATSRVVISRLLKKLENDGKVILYRNELKVMHTLKGN